MCRETLSDTQPSTRTCWQWNAMSLSTLGASGRFQVVEEQVRKNECVCVCVAKAEGDKREAIELRD